MCYQLAAAPLSAVPAVRCSLTLRSPYAFQLASPSHGQAPARQAVLQLFALIQGLDWKHDAAFSTCRGSSRLRGLRWRTPIWLVCPSPRPTACLLQNQNLAQVWSELSVAGCAVCM